MSRRPCTPTVTASPANMCRRTLFDHSEASPPASTITCLFNNSGDEDMHLGNSCETGGFNPRATAAVPVFPNTSEGSFRFPIAHHPSSTGHHVKHLPRLATVPASGWSDSRPFSKSLRRNTMATCEEEEDDTHYTDGSWNRRSTFLDFSDDSTPRRPSGVMDEHESPTPPRYQQQSFRDPSFGRNTVAFPVASASSSSAAPHVSLSLLPKSNASFSNSNSFQQQQRDADVITDRPIRRGTQSGFGFQGSTGSFCGFALSREDDGSRSQLSASVPFFADCDQYDDSSMLGMPNTDSSGTLPPARQDTMYFPQSCSQGTLPAESDPLAATCSYFPQDDSDPVNTICTPRPTIVHTAPSHSQATPSNKLSGGYYSSASLCEDDAPFEGTLRPAQNTITPHITHHHFANVMCTPQTSRVETEMRCALTAELETTNTLFYRVAPPLVTPLTDRVFLGGYPGEETLEELRGHGITHIINCCPTYKPPSDEMQREFQCHVIDAQDDPTFYILSEHMNDFRAMMDAAIGTAATGNNTKVFVHCAGGVNRSVVLVVAYLCEFLNLSPVCVVRMFRDSGRPYILSNTGFRIQLVEHYLHNVRTDLLRQ